MVELRDVLDDGKSEASASLLAAAVLVHAVEPFEDAAAMFWRDADAMVFYGEDGLPVADGDGERDVGEPL